MATITVLEARNLISTDPNGLSDPYCLIGVADPQTGNFVDKKACIRSETKRWTLTPAWKKGILEVNKRPSVVRVEIWDKDEDKEDDFVGLALIKLDSVQNTEDKWITLLTKHGKENKLGDIHVIVNIHQAAQAAPAIVQQTIQKAQSVPVTAQTTAKPAATTTHQTTAPTSAIPHVTGKPHPSATPHPTTTPTPTPTPIAANPVPATVSQPTTTPARPVSAIPAPAQTTSTPSQPTPARPTPNTTPTPVHPTPAHPTPNTTPTPVHPTPVHPTPAHPTSTQTTSRPTPAPAPTPQPASAPSRQVVTAPSAPKPAQPPANAAEIQKKNSELAQKHAKLAASYHSQGAIMEALEHYNLSSALYARAFGSGDKRAIATEQCATQLMMEISFGAFMA